MDRFNELESGKTKFIDYIIILYHYIDDADDAIDNRWTQETAEEGVAQTRFP